MVRLCCSWAQQLAQWASDVDWGEAEGAMRVALLWKAAILLWSTGRAAAAAADGDDRGEGPDVGGNRDGGPSEDAAASADDVPTEELLHELQSAVSMFSFTMVQVSCRCPIPGALLVPADGGCAVERPLHCWALQPVFMSCDVWQCGMSGPGGARSAQAPRSRSFRASPHALASATCLLLLLVQVPAPSVRRLLHLALQQLLKGLRPRLRLACLQALLMGAHPEEAALLLQCVQQLVEGLMQAAGRSSPGEHPPARFHAASVLCGCTSGNYSMYMQSAPLQVEECKACGK